jgi:23S rRNA (adenine2503-C2)-methyltransferase
MTPIDILDKIGDEGVAVVHLGRFAGSKGTVEFVRSYDPSVPRDEKLVVIVSTQRGCPVSCLMCDAGTRFEGNLTEGEILAQVDAAISGIDRKSLRRLKKFKVQFARMGEPTLNPSVLDVLRELPVRYDLPGLMPCIATIAPLAGRKWLNEMIEIRHEVYGGRPFQLQFSINTTDVRIRDRLMPIEKIPFDEMADMAARFYSGGPRKASLNFAMMHSAPIDPSVVARHFDPSCTCVKLTPLNPTSNSKANALKNACDDRAQEDIAGLVSEFKAHGFDVILSVGDTRENEIGSNCGMLARRAAESY